MFEETMYTLLKKEIMGDEKQCIGTHCKHLDELLGIANVCGIQRKLLTEFCGFPGSGKTQLCLQLCYSAILDDKKAVFVDTRGHFDVDRYKEIVSERLKDADTPKTVEDFLSSLYIVETVEVEEFINIINTQLEELVQHDPNISLIVVDCFPSLLRTIEPKVGDELRQYRIMHEMITTLQQIAYYSNVAVVLTNQFTVKMPDEASDSDENPIDEPFFVPALGSTFHHRIGQRLTLSTSIKGGKHLANLEKSKYNASRMVQFQITARGIE